MKPIVIVLKCVLATVLVWMVLMFRPMFDFDVIHYRTIFDLIGSIMDIASYGLAHAFGSLWDGMIGLSYLPFSGLNNLVFDENVHQIFGYMVRDEFITNFFSLTATNDITGEIITLNQFDFGVELIDLTSHLYLLIFQILAILFIIYSIMSLVQNDPKYSIKTIIVLNMMIIIPLVLMGIESMMQVFDVEFNMSYILGIFTPEEPLLVDSFLPYPLYGDIAFMKISQNFGEFLSSPIFQIALSGFVYLELSFQLNYVYQVTNPTEKRASRLKEQIESVKYAASRAIVDIERIEKGKDEVELDEDGNIIQKKKSESVRKFLTKGGTSFTYIQEMIDKRKLESKTKKLIEAKQETRRLSNYLVKLLKEDPEAEATLTARSSAPTTGRLIRSTVMDIFVRIGGITLIVFFISQTPWVLENIFGVPDAILYSVAMFTPEVMLTLIIPILMLFPFISFIIRSTKAQHLREKLNEEKIRREGISEDEELVPA